MTISFASSLRAITALALFVACGTLHAETITVNVLPTQVPDEMTPRDNLGDAPVGFGGSSWQGPETGKSNWHARYQADGDVLSTLFPEDAATLTINDIASISYYTKRPMGTPAGQDWWIQIYTRTGTGSDQAGWYGHKYTNNYNDHTNIGDWTQYSTDSGMTFDGVAITGEQDLAILKTNVGAELIEMISVQTDSGWNGFDGYIDGLEITLANGNVGVVNFQAVPEPSTVALLGLAGVAGLAIVRRRRQG